MGFILALPMDGVVELRTVARDLMGPRGEVASRSQFGGTEFTVDRSTFFEIGGASAKLKEGYFELPDLPDGKYLICHGKPVDAGELGIRVMHCARDLQIDRPAVVHVRKVSTEGGGFIVDVAPPPEDHGWW